MLVIPDSNVIYSDPFLELRQAINRTDATCGPYALTPAWFSRSTSMSKASWRTTTRRYALGYAKTGRGSGRFRTSGTATWLIEQ